MLLVTMTAKLLADEFGLWQLRGLAAGAAQTPGMGSGLMAVTLFVVYSLDFIQQPATGCFMYTGVYYASI